MDRGDSEEQLFLLYTPVTLSIYSEGHQIYHPLLPLLVYGADHPL
jgi:hypothetical protein